MEKFEEFENQPETLLCACSVPPAPRRFVPSPNLETKWQGKPSLAYGFVRYLAFKKRKENPNPYLRILFGEGGRKTVPWGSLWYEVNGVIYQFGSGIKRYPDTFLPSQAGLSPEGKRLLGSGIVGELTKGDLDFRWMQDEVDLTPILTPEDITAIQSLFENIAAGNIPPPVYQSRVWARRGGLPLRENSQTCTTFIGDVLSRKTGIPFSDTMPLELFEKFIDAVKVARGNEQTQLDCQLNRLLWIPEDELENLIKSIVPPGENLEGIGRGKADPNAPCPNFSEFVVKINL